MRDCSVGVFQSSTVLKLTELIVQLSHLLPVFYYLSDSIDNLWFERVEVSISQLFKSCEGVLSQGVQVHYAPVTVMYTYVSVATYFARQINSLFYSHSCV